MSIGLPSPEYLRVKKKRGKCKWRKNKKNYVRRKMQMQITQENEKV